MCRLVAQLLTSQEPSVLPKPLADIVIYKIPGAVLKYPLFNTPLSTESEAQPGGTNNDQLMNGQDQMDQWRTTPV